MVPQRDGFEFDAFLQKLMDENFKTHDEKSKAFSWIIYLIDLGKFLFESDVCIANLDESLDPGVLVEVMFAKQMGKPVVGYRTDSRPTYGDIKDIH